MGCFSNGPFDFCGVGIFLPVFQIFVQKLASYVDNFVADAITETAGFSTVLRGKRKNHSHNGKCRKKRKWF